MPDDNNKSAMRTVKGQIVLKTFARTTKSEDIGVYLQTAEESFLIRPVGGVPSKDNPLAALAGKFIVATGRKGDHVFFADSWEEIPEEEARKYR